MSGPMPEALGTKYVQLLYVLNWLENVGEKIELFEANELLPMRFAGKNASIAFDDEKKKWIGIEITTGDDL